MTTQVPKLEPILVWRFEHAPEVLRQLSPHGGDEDWVAEVPPCLSDDYIPWLDEGGPFGCCSVSEHDHPLREKSGWRVYIGAHS